MPETMTKNEQETILFNLTEENKHLLNFAEKTNKFFEEQTSIIQGKCVANIVNHMTQLRKESDLVSFLSYEDLNLFEQISLVALEGNLPNYPEVMFAITSFCEAEIKLLDESDKFIVSHRYRNFDKSQYSPIQELENAFIEYATNYTNDKLSEYR